MYLQVTTHNNLQVRGMTMEFRFHLIVSEQFRAVKREQKYCNVVELRATFYRTRRRRRRRQSFRDWKSVAFSTPKPKSTPNLEWKLWHSRAWKWGYTLESGEGVRGRSCWCNFMIRSLLCNLLKSFSFSVYTERYRVWVVYSRIGNQEVRMLHPTGCGLGLFQSEPVESANQCVDKYQANFIKRYYLPIICLSFDYDSIQKNNN